ncbi:condensation domain-containing protein [Amycolatopsis keratiniphila]|uniref:Condensation domain-containing protein n=1 Tax=Amycolatopsis keratiniphila TaxID=129921 RepID=R4SZH0_9PSEU|nr:condensation domain-containing protein [Amycolatopsis keratiniphila]AGM07925.1 condensation domain-containing protein [Amycolatopsis keratiniphila]
MSVRDGLPSWVRPEARMPLSGPQERMWLLDQVGDDQMPTNSPLAFRVHGPLDVAAMKDAVAGVRRRHDVLRTRYAMTASGPVQWVTSADDLDWSEVDLSGETDPTCRITADVLARFDLTSSDPLRVRVYHLGPDDHLLLVVTHHIVSDARADEILVRELACHYRHAAFGTMMDLPELPVQYTDYAVRESEAGAASGEDYWAAALAGVPVVRPPGQGGAGASRVHHVVLPDELVRAVGELARACRVSPFMVLLAAFRLVLWRAWSQPDVVVGTPMSCRTTPEVQDLIGNFLVMVPLRTALQPVGTFRDLVARERATVLGAYVNQGALPQRVPPFSVTFSYEPDVPLLLDLGPGTAVEPHDLGGALVQYDLMVKMVGRRIEWAYRDEAVDGGAVVAWADEFLRVLGQVLGSPNEPLAGPAGALPAEPQPETFEVTWVGNSEPEQEWTQVERIVVDLWEELIGTRPRRASDGFFELGGHSLSAARLAFRLTEELGVPVTVAQLLEHARLNEQAELVEDLLRAELGKLDPAEIN